MDAPLLVDRLPPTSVSEFVSTAIFVWLFVNVPLFLMYRAGYIFTDSDGVAIITTHVIIAVVMALVWGLMWWQDGRERKLSVYPELVEYTERNRTLCFPKHGTTVTLSLVRGHNSHSDNIVISNPSVDKWPRTLPEALTGSPDRFCDLMEAHGWAVNRPPRHNGRLY